MNKRLSAYKECHYFKLRNTCYVRVLEYDLHNN